VDVEYQGDSNKHRRKSFAELDSAIQDKRGEFYEIRAVVRNYSANITLTFKITNFFSHRLIVELEQSSVEILDDVFEKIKRIVCANYVTGWQRHWARIRFFGAFLMLMSISGASTLYTSSTTTDDARAQHVKQAQELIDRGVKPEDLPRAIDLTLRLQINYPSSSSTTYPFRHRRVFTGLAAMFGVGILLFSGPKGVMVGLGHGKSAIKSRKERVKLLVAVGLFLVPAIVDAVKPAVLDTLFKWLQG